MRISDYWEEIKQISHYSFSFLVPRLAERSGTTYVISLVLNLWLPSIAMAGKVNIKLLGIRESRSPDLKQGTVFAVKKDWEKSQSGNRLRGAASSQTLKTCPQAPQIR